MAVASSVAPSPSKTILNKSTGIPVIDEKTWAEAGAPESTEAVDFVELFMIVVGRFYEIFSCQCLITVSSRKYIKVEGI